ncbi:MAG: DegT/DnrJ/EryC1/StrS family aminotransferase [Rhodoferax sp.]|nr:DegT/DnrJ/EryC1/StrS family aminotransferase [Rhodoferax sp.]
MSVSTTSPSQTLISDAQSRSGTSPPLPRGPILDWSSFQLVDAPGISSVEDLPHTAFTTSGRAAIYQALLQLQLPPGSTVLAPSYHCPTMIAPVILANLNVAYFGIRADGLPNLDTINPAVAAQSKAMIVAHYFGLARSLAEVRRWCDERGIALIEDCAHCYFGEAGERPVGAWGDYSTASLSKFLPVPEGGLLASANRSISDLRLSRQSLKAQLKGWADVFELATKYKRFYGFNKALDFLFRLKNSRLRPAATAVAPLEPGPASMMRDCDMGRISHAPLAASMTLKAVLPRGRVILRRQRNFACYAKHLEDVQGARPLFPLGNASFSHMAPYVFPLWVDDADRLYHGLRAMELPVFRWDRVWPGTPALNGDNGPLWSGHVLQLLCHQDLSEADIHRTAEAIRSLLSSEPVLTTLAPT